MESKKFMVLEDHIQIRGIVNSVPGAKSVGHFFERKSNDDDFVFKCGNIVHLKSRHGPAAFRKKWRVAEKRFSKRYMPGLFRMILEGVKCERF